MAEDKQYTRSVFYIGTDDRLYQVGNVDWKWLAFTRASDASWPDADPGQRQLAIANDFESSQARVYYVSGGGIVEAASTRGIWTGATSLASWNTTAAAAAADATATDGSGGDAGSGSGSGMSSGAKAGIGVGVSLGIFAIGGSIAAFFLMRRSQRKKDEEREKAERELQSEYGGSPTYSHSQPVMANGAYYPAPGYPPQQQQPGDGAWPLQHQQQQGGQANWGTKPGDANSSVGVSPVEMETSQIYEMDAHHRPLEMMGEGHYQEMGDNAHAGDRR